MVSFYSKENLILEGGFNSTVQFHNSGYATNHSVWPSISIEIQDDLTADDELIPKTFALHQNYPNPFNPYTIIRFDLPRDIKVQIEVYDVLGRLVKNLASNNQMLDLNPLNGMPQITLEAMYHLSVPIQHKGWGFLSNKKDDCNQVRPFINI